MKDGLRKYKIILFLAALGPLLPPAINLFYAHPHFRAIFIQQIEHEVSKEAKILFDKFSPQKIFDARTYDRDLVVLEIKQIVALLRIKKINIFDQTGKIIFSSEQEKIGKTHPNRNFVQIMEKGKLYSKFIHKHEKDLEADEMQYDVVEVYYPSLDLGGKFFGALEIYVDVSNDFHKYEEAIYKLNWVVISVPTVLIIFFIFFYIRLRDFTNKLEDRGRKIVRLLGEKNKMIGRLGHDLKTPLTPLSVLLPEIQEEIKKLGPNKELVEMVGVCNQSVDFMKGLAKNIMNMARFDVSQYKLNYSKIDVFEIIKMILISYQKILDEKAVKMSIYVAPETYILGDEIGITEIFYNLISNAVKFTAQNGEIKISVISYVENKQDYLFFIEDNGIGLDDADKEKIFDDFYKADSKLKDDLSSHGLGLAICKNIVEAHGGKIWAESKGRGSGTTFYFTLQKHPT